MARIELKTLLTLVKATNEYLDKIEEHVKTAPLSGFTTLAAQEWYMKLTDMLSCTSGEKTIYKEG